MTVIWCTVPEIWSAIDRTFCHSGPSLVLSPPSFPLLPYEPKKSKFWKNEKNTWRYYYFTNVYHKWQLYDVWFLRYGAQRTRFFVVLDYFFLSYALTTRKIKSDGQNVLSFWTVFCPFILLTIQKIKILKNWKKA